MYWKQAGTYEVVIENIDFQKFDTLVIEVKENPIPYFYYRYPSPDSNNIIQFIDSMSNTYLKQTWYFSLDGEPLRQDRYIDSIKSPTFLMPLESFNSPKILANQVTHQSGCTNSYVDTLFLRQPLIDGNKQPCKGSIETYTVTPNSGVNFYVWDVVGGYIDTPIASPQNENNNERIIHWTDSVQGKVIVYVKDYLIDETDLEPGEASVGSTPEDSTFITPENTATQNNVIFEAYDTLYVTMKDTNHIELSISPQPQKVDSINSFSSSINTELEFNNLTEFNHSQTWTISENKGGIPSSTIFSYDSAAPYYFEFPGLYNINLNTLNQNLCISDTTLQIIIVDEVNFVIENIVTPNDDGINDYLTIQNIESYPFNTIQVTSMTGETVFEQTNYQNDWNLTYNNDYLPAGNYICIFKADNFDNVFKQVITVIRWD